MAVMEVPETEVLDDMSELLGTIWVCVDCMLVHANGECDPERPEDLPAPLSRIGEGFSITMGLLAEEHDEECPVCITRDHNAVECDCEREIFATYPCRGCGDSHHGERHAMALWREV